MGNPYIDLYDKVHQDEENKHSNAQQVQQPAVQTAQPKSSGNAYIDLYDTAQQQKAKNTPAPNASVHPGGGTALSALTSALGKIAGQGQRFQQGIQQRREQSLSELNALTEAAPYVASAEEGAQNAARRRELTKSLEASDAILGNDPRYYDEASRWAGVAKGNLQGLAGGYLSAAGTLAQRGTQDEIGQILNDSAYSGYMTDPLAIEQMRQAVENGWRPESIGVYDDVDKVIQKGDQLLDSSRETTAKAKNGADKTQNLLIDMSGSATGMAADKALVALTGLKPLGLVNMGIRTFGEGAYEARKQGLDANKQVAAGVSSAISEIGPELIFGGMSEIYGNSAAKKIGGELLKKVAPKLTSKIASSQGLSLLFDLAGRFGGESIEEMSSNVVKPVLDRLFGVEKYKKFWDFAIKDGKLDDDFVANTLYEGLLGGIMGVLGGGAENVQTYARYGTVSKAEVEAAQKAMLEGAEAAMDRAIEKKAAEQPSESPSAKPTLAEPKTDAQKRVANLVNGATTQEQLAEVLQKIQGSPALDAALEELTGMDAEAHLARSAQEATGDILAPEGTETPEAPVEASTEAPAELNSGNTAVESSEPAAPSKKPGKKGAQHMATDALLADMAKERDMDMGGIDIDASDYDDGDRSGRTRSFQPSDAAGVDLLIGDQYNPVKGQQVRYGSKLSKDAYLTKMGRESGYGGNSKIDQYLDAARDQIQDDARNTSRIADGQGEWAELSPRERAELLKQVTHQDWYVSDGKVVKAKYRVESDTNERSDFFYDQELKDSGVEDVSRQQIANSNMAGSGKALDTIHKESDAPAKSKSTSVSAYTAEELEDVQKTINRSKARGHRDAYQRWLTEHNIDPGQTPIRGGRLGEPRIDIRSVWMQRVMRSKELLGDLVNGTGNFKQWSAANRLDALRTMYPDANWQFDGKTNTISLPAGAAKSDRAFDWLFDKQKGAKQNENGRHEQGQGVRQNERGGAGYAGTEISRRTLDERPELGLEKAAKALPRPSGLGAGRHGRVSARLTELGFKVFSEANLPKAARDIQNVIRKVAPNCPVTFFTSEGITAKNANANQKKVLAYGCIFQDETKDGRSAGIFVDLATAETQAKSQGCSVAAAVMHDVGHYYIAEHGLSPFAIASKIGFQSQDSKEAIHALAEAYENAKRSLPGIAQNQNLTEIEKETAIWNEVVSDLFGGVDRYFNTPAGSKHFLSLVKATREFFNNYDEKAAAKMKSSGATRSFVPESSAEYIQQTRLTRKDFERREAERAGIEAEYKAENAEANEEIAHDEAYEKAKSDAEKLADAKKAYGEAIHQKMTKTAEKLKGLVGNSRVTERGNEGFTYREGGKDIESFAHVFNEFAAGRQTFRQVADAYAKLNSPSNEKKGSYFYDEIFGGQFETLAEAFENGDYTRKDGTLDPDFARRVEELSKRVTHRFEYMQKMLAFRDHLSQVYEGEGAFKTKAGMLAKALEAANRFQLRPSTAFKMLSGYNKKGGYAWYQLADMARDATKNYINTFQTAQDYLRDLTERKDWSDFSTGKTTVKNVIPGLKYGERLSANAALSFLKMLETNGSYDHIIRNGLVEMARTEKELYSGKNNNGFGDATGYSQTFDPISKETRAKLDSAKTAKEKAAAWNQARAELDALKGALRSEIESAPAAKAAYEASFAPLNFLAKALNKTSRAVWGSDVAVQGKFYWPLEAGGKRLGQELLNDHSYGLDQYRNVQERTGDRGGLMVRPFTDVMQGYIRNASHWAAYQELSDTLHILSKDFRGTQSITQLLNDNAGKPWSKWLENYEADLNGTRGKDKGWASKVIGGLRSNLAQSSLLLNAGVAMKQAPSGLDFMTVLDADIVAKRFATGALRSARSFSNNPLIQTMEQYSKMLKNRQAGYNTVETGEATEVGRKGAINKFVANLPSWMTNWITKTDYRTVANGLLACEDQVKRNIKNGAEGYADIKVGSDEYYQAIADLFENAVMDTQPIYNKEYRAEALRTDNEMLRTLGMFRTQQTQNYNNLVETIGEFKAAKASGDAKEIASARNRMARTIGGQVSAAVMFAMLDGAAKLMLHKKKQYEDEEGELDANKFMQKAGWNMLSSLAGTSWLGSKVAPFLINNASNMLNMATGGKVSKAEIYNGAVDGTLGMVDDFANALKSFNEKPSLKTGKSLVLTFSSMIGLPTRNAYNLLNAAAMYGIDFGMKGLNVKNEDDIINLLNGYYGAAASTRGKQAVDRALALAKNGHDDQADRIFSTLDTSDADLFKAAKNELKNAFVMGEISEQTYRDMLRKYFGANSQEVIKLVRAGKEKQADNEFTAAMQSKLGEDAYKEFTDSMKQLNVETDPAGEKRFAAITSLDLSDDYTDRLVQKYMGSNYADSYDALRSIGIKPRRANQILQSIDTDSAKSGFNVSQSELYDWLLDNPQDERVVKAIWDSKGYKTEWSDYQESQANNPVNILASYVGSRDKAEQAYKSMDSDGNGSLKQEEFFAYLKAHPEQEEALRAVFEAKWPKSNFDQKRRKYA